MNGGRFGGGGLDKRTRRRKRVQQQQQQHQEEHQESEERGLLRPGEYPTKTEEELPLASAASCAVF